MIFRIFAFATLLSTLLCSASAQVTLQPWTEVFGTVNGQQLGKYVTGLTPSANLPFRAAVSQNGSTSFFRPNRPTDTVVQLILPGENVLTGDLNEDGRTDVVVGKTVNGYDTVYIYWGTSIGIDTLTPLRIPGEAQLDRFKPGCVADINNDGFLDLINIAPNFGPDQGKVTIHLGPNITRTPSAEIVGDSVRSGLGGAVSVGDLNNDGYNDLMIRGWKQAGSSDMRYDYVNIYLGIGVDSLNLALWMQIKTKSLVLPALACFDANADSTTDLLWTTADSIDTYINIHFGRTNFDTIPDLRLRNPGVANFGNIIANGGDLNGDGYSDVLVGASAATITNGYVFVYPGGSNIDGFYHAYATRSTDARFGASVSSVGDITGDGLSDFIVGAPLYPFGEAKGYWAIFKGDTAIHVTDVPETTTKPQEFRLYDAYPNPFNPSTVISYNLPVGAHVTLKVYDLLGREVATLVDGFVPPGKHEASFDASRYSSGIYLYRIQAGSFASVKKLVLVK